ncbi:MAG: acetyl-CoA carboxylase biotin carboxyl carrier protein subunit, partial [Candidatus Delongbacteria bacterium]|nr:acetyl-CoA carboxylase biotin carboxyl carrier protein subunit [Candidatus Delongbacteria bacterium]
PLTSDKKFSQIKAPLPGNILSVKIKEGDEVKKGDVLLVMEAMKMENNVLADVDGTVKSVKVNEGDAVLQNDDLIEIQ